MSKVKFCFKFLVRFIVLSFLILVIAIASYTSFFANDVQLLEKTMEKVSLKIEQESNYNISFDSFYESWSINGLVIVANEMILKNDNLTIKAKKAYLDIDIIKTLQNQRLTVDKIVFDKVDAHILSEKKEESFTNAYYNIKELISIFKEIELEVSDISVNYGDINLNKIDLIKPAFENSVILSNKKDISLKIDYSITEKNDLRIKSFLNSNNFHVKKTVNLLGLGYFIELIKFDEAYSVVGDINAEIDLVINLKNKKIKDYAVWVALGGNKVVLNYLEEITLTNVVGNLYYTMEKGLFTDKLVGNLDRKKTFLEIHQKGKNNITFDFETRMDVDKISKIVSFPLNKIITGSEIFKGNYSLNFNETDYLNIKSSFQDMDYISEIPIKSGDGLVVDAYLDYENNNMSFNVNQYNHNANIKFAENKFYNINLAINQKITKSIKEKGFNVNGYLTDVDIFSMANYLSYLKEEFYFNEGVSEENNVKINMAMKETLIGDIPFEEINLLYQNNTTNLLFNEDSSIGSISINNRTNVVDINVESLNIKTKEAVKALKNNKDVTKTLMEKKNNFELPKNIPIIDINITAKNIKIDDYPSLALETNLILKDGILETEKLTIKDENQNVRIKGLYQYDSIRDVSTIIEINNKTPILKIKDLSQFQKDYFKDLTGFQSSHLNLSGNFSWDGFKLKELGKTLNGYFELDIGSGFIPKDSTQIGLAKTLNIFNFDSWFNFLLLDFDEMEKGLPFNSIKGGFIVKDNVVDITPRIILDSDLFLLEMKGTIDYVQSVYDIQMDAIVPLINKAPVIALFAGVAPEIVGIIWVVDKIAGSKLDETFSRSSFNINGTFENPVYTGSSKEDSLKIDEIK